MTFIEMLHDIFSYVSAIVITVVIAFLVAHTLQMIIGAVVRLPRDRFIEVMECLVAIVFIAFLFKKMFWDSMRGIDSTHQYALLGFFVVSMFVSIGLYIFHNRPK